MWGQFVGVKQEEFIRRFLDAWGDGQLERPDVEVIAEALSEDVVWQLWMPGGPALRGKTAVVADIERQLVFATHMRCGVLAIASTDTTVVTERLDTFRSGEVTVEHSLCAVFELDGSGRIEAWREYFDVADLQRQLREAKATVPPVAAHP
jgi:limonene-1,2-epoxide hydrolase